MEPEAREEIFERAREYSTRPAGWEQADVLWLRVIEAYRQAVGGAQVDRHDQRQLARALWRHSMVLAAMGRHDRAKESGHEAVTLFAEIHQAVAAEHPDPTQPRRDEALGELITAMVDCGESAFVAGSPEVRLELLEKAVEIGLHTAGPPPGAGPSTRAAMATAYHNHANALLHRHQQQGAAADAREAALAGSRATELRLKALDPHQPITIWELANTYSIYAHALVAIGDVERAGLVVKQGSQLTDLLGAGGTEIQQKLRAAEALVRQASGGGGRRWPWRRR
ncbi:hypothetical protein [Micromonospora sediminimaris]|uniref:Uncharacterized protein n=1 Tax=Micromonospora sediminimaris TaxID=547162 RepID=A0A9W5XN01_9ACTN|nr:hypothetical protein [Micromonospora sediminimaris]GIJ35538.1 hypothetical protein Vse01_46860 [Micromonospora sediminimaris]SFD23788.1 hypothetical protein SAMN05216284_113118 [Micromonospora sediminimaris]